MNWRKFLVSILAIILLLGLAYLISNALSGMAEVKEEGKKEAATLYVKTEKVAYFIESSEVELKFMTLLPERLHLRNDGVKCLMD